MNIKFQKVNKIIYLIIILFLLTGCDNKNKSNKTLIKNNQIIEKPDYQEKYINSASGLVLRENPAANKKRIDVIPFGEKIEIIETKNKIVKIGSKQGKWVRVLWGGITGWVFDAYLSNDKPSKPLSEFERTLIKGAWYYGNITIKYFDNGTADSHIPEMYYSDTDMEGEYNPQHLVDIVEPGYWSYDKEMNLFIFKCKRYSAYYKVMEWNNEKIILFELNNDYEIHLHKTEEPKYYDNY